MGLLKGEQYSKEAYQEAEKSLLEEKTKHDISITSESGYDDFDGAIEKAKKRLNNLYEKSHKESLDLNEEYNTLINNVEKAVHALTKFESEKLGMNDKSEND